MKIVITGNIPSKKNSKQIVHSKGRTFLIPSKNHKDWHTEAMSQLAGIKPVARQIERVELTFYPSTKRLFDLSNKAESIMDLLVDAGIIEDDNYSIVPKLILDIGEQDKKNPRCEISIL